MCFRISRSTIRVPVTEGGAASERDSAAGRLHDTAGSARLSHHRIRRIRLLTVSDIFDRRCPDAIYDLTVSQASGLIDKSPCYAGWKRIDERFARHVLAKLALTHMQISLPFFDE